jgi:hypothetical protein
MANQTTPFEVDLTDGGAAVTGHTTGRNSNGVGYGVHGVTDIGVGVVGYSNTGVGVEGTSTSNAGVTGQSTSGTGVTGQSTSGNGVVGSSASAVGISGTSGGLSPGDPAMTGVLGVCASTEALGLLGGTDRVFSQHAGVYGQSDQQGVFGNSTSDTGTGVYGINRGASGFGMRGETNEGTGVQGRSFGGGTGVRGISAEGIGVYAQGPAATPAVTTAQSGYAIYATSNVTGIFAQGSPAGYFRGDVQVTGDVILINSSGDIAEDFDVDGDPAGMDPGTVLVITPAGSLRASTDPYDTRVAGVVAGADALRPALLLQRIESRPNRAPIALVGKVLCKVDASFGSILAGDLLTTSPTSGHAMKVSDRARAMGALVGKALNGLEAGRALIPILVAPR